MEELVDIYDIDRKRTGRTVPRADVFTKEGEYTLYVLALLEDAEGRFLITQRSPEKKWAAGWWETCGGGVSAGETSAQALVREVSEEVGLDVSGMAHEPVYGYVNVDLERGDNYIVDIYHCHLDFTLDDVTLQETETVDCKLATWDEIRELGKGGTFLHYERLRQALEAEGVL